MIDCHVHLAALRTTDNGCYISPKLLNSPLFRFLLWKHRLPIEDAARSNQKYVEELLLEIRRSKHVKKAVLLGMDGVYDANGMLDTEKTEFLVGNDYVLKLARSYPNEFLPGVSINPQRRDARDELDRCVAAGAKLVKVLPNTQGFDPGNRKYIPFYKKLAQLKIPLLSHVGYEFTLTRQDQSVGDPDKLRVPLDEGVTVIAAHGCSAGLVFYERYIPTFLNLVRLYTNFFADVSALTLPNRFGMLLRLRRYPETHERLLFGTDYPHLVFRWPCWGRIGLRDFRTIIQTNNRFDRKYLILQSLGVGFRSVDQLMTSSCTDASVP
ncbi:MAG TPA: amidohydrolase family protein [Nitrospiraceae bacterium]|nr:amidohydrolase family protein [Nitrospiraceae bacterium]